MAFPYTKPFPNGLPDARLFPKRLAVKRGGRNLTKAAVKMISLLVVAAFAFYQLVGAGLIWGKAWLAPILIERAWEVDKANGWSAANPTKPWGWADTYPAMKLSVERAGKIIEEQFVLAEPTMRALAFGPVLLDDSDATILFGHRETHFKMLGDLDAGDRIIADLRGGAQRVWTVRTNWVTTEDAMFVPDRSNNHTRRDLLMVTCYPLDGLTPTDQRYIVWATAE
jgi:sortase A